ncbi:MULTISPECIES: copper homeostasis protein CutC [Tenebrionibacter/Tenebrionicola group]|jgi:copper homeostasis protein|uniref:PF03932 family protein CutC n=2 Tax=Tenebrionibacter/Tenebrionicola group TaxID=2969848 RepID=A0A8K0XXR7_9ENTR|nr:MULTISPECIES: copper homeostasis protein CutC [Tenebrionibacter/Tenebrionicola group]MBK4713779.1 copper homeostasis protein CutC [Tenebrionibacter intestinalis]MBV4411610.1 copper homeostasis protein CutC [Tenebrionicola larvae]MBV5094660.1 copper homeostasis protein CutC [Tenebrionicola larvae]
MALLEICCYGMDCAIAAAQAGADRIELCAAPNEGGITPSAGVLRGVRRRVSIPVHPIIRPRGGDFCYSAGEFSVMLDDIALVRELGFPGLVTGVLDEDGNIDLPRMAQIMSAAHGMAVTFHRAFDMCRDPFTAAAQLARLGVARILTSGQAKSAEAGLSLIRELKQQSATPIIMAGAGVRLNNLAVFVDAGIEELHSSAGMFQPSPMRFRQAAVSMSSGEPGDEFSRYAVDVAAVAAMKAALAAK